MEKKKLDVTGMTCAACASTVEKAVCKLDGVKNANVNLLDNSMTVEYDESAIDVKRIADSVSKVGYGVVLPTESKSGAAEGRRNIAESEIKELRTRFIVSLVFTLPLFYISMGHMMGLPIPSFFHGTENALTFAFTQLLLCLPVVMVNYKYFTRGFKSLFRLHPNMDTLIAIGSLASVVYGVIAIYAIGIGLGRGDTALVDKYGMDLYFESGAMILTLITLGKLLETRAKGKTGEAIEKLIKLRPDTATVDRGNGEEKIPTADVKAGDIVIVRAGETVPVDGEVTEGSGYADEAALTGESVPVEKSVGDKLIGASIVTSGYVRMRATKVGEDTVLSEIIKLVGEAAASKAPISKLADRISGVFVPIVILIAVIAASVWAGVGKGAAFAVSIGVAVLVISCPCALGLATPTAIMVGTGRGAYYGVLFKNAEILEKAHTIDTVVLDKTGTVTEGKPAVTDILPFGVDERELLSALLALESKSEHPLARAIVAYGEEKGIESVEVGNYKTLSGMGISGGSNGAAYLVGNRSLMESNGVTDIPTDGDRLRSQGKTVIYAARNGKLIGIVGIADKIKSDSKEAVRLLKGKGVDVIMLTGDNEATAKAIAAEAGIDNVIADVLPAQKEEKIRALRDAGKTVAMVGDGINDAPALARADVGIAIGAGTDIAVEAGDVVLVKNSLVDVATMIDLSAATMRNIRENLFWALIYNTLGIPLAAGVFFPWLQWKLNPMYAAAAMSLSSVCVVLNALRLRAFRPRHLNKKRAKSAKAEQAAAAVDGSEEIDYTVEKESYMVKTIYIEGMSCMHCAGRVEAVLSGLNDVISVKVDLQGKKAVVECREDIADTIFETAIAGAGYTVVAVS